ncbi:MAG: DUF692 family protein [Phycisphaera sp.]|nr:DUF692 family protein [Phycisphaera sp.]
MTAPRLGHPNLGLGVGLRTVHFAHILSHRPRVDWFEIISENFMDSRGRPRHVLDLVRAHYPVVMHGVSMSIGSTDPLNVDYLRRLKALADDIQPAWVSDHLCWTGVAGRNSHDLLPMPLNRASLDHVVDRIKQVQDTLERTLVLENPSSYVTFTDSTIAEHDFLAEMAERADCGLLLDVNNVYVSCFNHDLNAEAYLRALPHDRVVQFHLAGHSNYDTHINDTHDNHVIDAVWALYKLAHDLTGGVSTLLEWDANIPPFDVVHAEVLKAKRYIGADIGDAGESNELDDTPIDTTPLQVPHPLHHVTPEVE